MLGFVKICKSIVFVLEYFWILVYEIEIDGRMFFIFIFLLNVMIYYSFFFFVCRLFIRFKYLRFCIKFIFVCRYIIESVF